VQQDHLPDYRMTLDEDQAVFVRRGAVGDAPEAPDARGEGAPARERAIRISPDAFDAVLEYAPGWDRYALEQTYAQWARDKDPARNEDARFLGWVKSFTKGKSAA
jgi:hypothetical protein